MSQTPDTIPAREAAADHPERPLADVLNELLHFSGALCQADRDRKAAEQREREARYHRDVVAVRAAAALIEAGCDPRRLVRVGQHVFRFNDCGCSQYALELLDTQAVGVDL